MFHLYNDLKHLFAVCTISKQSFTFVNERKKGNQLFCSLLLKSKLSLCTESAADVILVDLLIFLVWDHVHFFEINILYYFRSQSTPLDSTVVVPQSSISIQLSVSQKSVSWATLATLTAKTDNYNILKFCIKVRNIWNYLLRMHPIEILLI